VKFCSNVRDLEFCPCSYCVLLTYVSVQIMTSHFLAQDLKHINSKLTYQCDMTQKRDLLIVHPFSLMVNQTSEIQVLGSGSTFKRSSVSIFTSAHPRTLLEPAQSSSRPHVLLLPQSCHIDFLRSAKAGL